MKVVGIADQPLESLIIVSTLITGLDVRLPFDLGDGVHE